MRFAVFLDDASGEIRTLNHPFLRMSGYKVQGKTLPAVEQLMRDAVALERAGAFAIVLEGVPREVAAMITAGVSVPTIGIGAGPAGSPHTLTVALDWHQGIS